MERYLEDYAPGQTYACGRVEVDIDRIKSFAAEFDPQPFHLDDEAARSSVFRGLAASGWHTAALSMRLLVDGELRPAGGIIGVAGDELAWPRPTRPGDVLTARVDILETRPSTKRPDQGLVKIRLTTSNASDEVVQVAVMNLLVRRRPTD